MVLLEILLATIFISLLSFSGIFLLKINKQTLKFILPLLVSFAAGVLLGDVFIHIAPEAISENPQAPVMLYILIGVVAFLIIEKLLIWHHHKDFGDDHSHSKLSPEIIMIADGAHNFFDGVIIATSFIADFNLGIFSTFAIMLHEIPQEIGDFAILLKTGMKPKKVILYTFLAQLTSVAGGIITYFFLNNIADLSKIFLPIAGGGLLYIATSDIIPELNKEVKLKQNFIQILALLLGIAVMYYFKIMFA